MANVCETIIIAEFDSEKAKNELFLKLQNTIKKNDDGTDYFTLGSEKCFLFDGAIEDTEQSPKKLEMVFSSKWTGCESIEVFKEIIEYLKVDGLKKFALYDYEPLENFKYHYTYHNGKFYEGKGNAHAGKYMGIE